MKKIQIILFFLFIANLTVSACDICGCGVGSYYLGILPEFNKRFVGVRYQHKLLQSHLGPQGNRTPLTADETYQSLELWGAWNFGSRWRAMAILPYNFNRREIPGSGETGFKDGFGDVALMGYYKLVDGTSTTSSNKLMVHSLWAGMGVKIPTGDYDDGERSTVSQDSPNNFQLGTASTDFLVNIAYDIRLMDIGLNTNVNYKVNTANRHEYRYGNKLTANVLAYHKFTIRNQVRIAPNIGFMYETQTKDVVFRRYDVAQSGGNVLTGVVGLELTAGKLSLGGNFQAPLSQNLADGRVNVGNRWMTHLSWAF